MLRKLHAALSAPLIIVVLALSLSGAVLSVAPMLEALDTAPEPSALTVAALADRITSHIPDVERIDRRASGQIVVFYQEVGGAGQVIVDPSTGEPLRGYERSEFFSWMADFHRGFWTGDSFWGKAAAGLGALALVLIGLSGIAVLVQRSGGWRQVVGPVRGSRSQRLHVNVARLTLPLLLLSAVSGLYMSLAFFQIVPEGLTFGPDFPALVDGGPAADVGSLIALQETPVYALRRLIFPYPDEPDDVFQLVTEAGDGYVDQSTGRWLTFLPHSPARRLYESLVSIHTGHGNWWIGLASGIAALAVPLLAITGVAIWWRERRSHPRVLRSVEAADADIVILVGSEGGATWGFALTLQSALAAAGHFVHVGPMSQIGPQHCGDKRMFILAATYGDGSAPESARRFFTQLAKLDARPERGVTVLGFGDREFDHFAFFAREAEAAMAAKGWHAFAPMSTVNRQSPQEFARWGEDLGKVLGEPLRLVHIAEAPRAQRLRLTRRRDYKEGDGPATMVLRFVASQPPLSLYRLIGRGRVPAFRAGDLLGVLPPGSNMPRYYSLCSSSQDGALEIAVRRHEHGLCSCHLHNLTLSDEIRAFVRPNPEFNLQPGRAPVILIGGGCGVGPLAGFIRANRKNRPIRLYFGARDPGNDYLYKNEFSVWLADGRLGALITTFSAGREIALLPDRLTADSALLGDMLAQGATVMVAGGRGMAESVRKALGPIAEAAGTSLSKLRDEGRYVEDVF